MEMKAFDTLIKGACSEHYYAAGWTEAMSHAICEEFDESRLLDRFGYGDNDRVLTVRCTQEQYNKFKQVVEKEFPGLCEFDMIHEMLK